MSTYSRYNDGDCHKRSSGTAKTALGLGIAGLGTALVAGGLFGGNGGCGDCDGCGNNGGLLGNLFGGRNGSNCSYCKEQKRLGEQARDEIQMLDKYLFPIMERTCNLETETKVNPLLTEREMVDKWILPLMHRTCNIEKEIAVNEAKDEKDQVIQGLLFKIAENNTNSKFDMLQQRTDAEFALGRAITTGDIERATCNVVRGKPYISPCQMADPYSAGANVLMARHFNTYTNGTTTYSDGYDGGCGCGCNGAWSGLV